MDKTIRAEEAAYDGFRQLAKEYELSNPELLAAMVQYFRVTKADPRHPTGPDLTSSLAKLTAKLADLDKRTIGFIREQEKTYLKPILAEVQAHKVLTPAASASVGISKAQGDDLVRWFVRILSKGMLPDQLTPDFLRNAPTMGVNNTPEDPALSVLKKALAGILQVAFRPELMVPAMAPKSTPPPSTPAVPIPAPPTQPA